MTSFESCECVQLMSSKNSTCGSQRFHFAMGKDATGWLFWSQNGSSRSWWVTGFDGWRQGARAAAS